MSWPRSDSAWTGCTALAPIVDEAIARWSLLSPDAAGVLAEVRFEVVDLPGLILGRASGSTVWLDATAAGHGWFIDPTPSDDIDFGYGGVDTLTVVMHELGHVLGLDQADSIGQSTMSPSLDSGVRQLASGGLEPAPASPMAASPAGEVPNVMQGPVAPDTLIRAIHESEIRIVVTPANPGEDRPAPPPRTWLFDDGTGDLVDATGRRDADPDGTALPLRLADAGDGRVVWNDGADDWILSGVGKDELLVDQPSEADEGFDVVDGPEAIGKPSAHATSATGPTIDWGGWLAYPAGGLAASAASGGSSGRRET